MYAIFVLSFGGAVIEPSERPDATNAAILILSGHFVYKYEKVSLDFNGSPTWLRDC